MCQQTPEFPNFHKGNIRSVGTLSYRYINNLWEERLNIEKQPN